MGKWIYKVNSSNSSWSKTFFPSKKDAVLEARKNAVLLGEFEFQVGRVEPVSNYDVDVDYIIEDLKNNLIDKPQDMSFLRLDVDLDFSAECFKVAAPKEIITLEGSIPENVEEEIKEELKKSLNEAIRNWQLKHNYHNKCFKIVECDSFKLKQL